MAIKLEETMIAQGQAQTSVFGAHKAKGPVPTPTLDGPKILVPIMIMDKSIQKVGSGPGEAHFKTWQKQKI